MREILRGLCSARLLYRLGCYFRISNKKKLFKLFLVFAVLFALGCSYAVFLSVNMAAAAFGKPNIITGEQRTVIILGCQIRGDNPSVMLAGRLSAALELLLEDENTVCVVTGGLGKNQTRTEADVMREWLISKGVSQERIFLEDKSTSTTENLEFAFNIITENNLPTDVIIVSDGFHLYRAKILGNRHFDQIDTYGAQTRFIVLPTYWVREWISISAMFVFK